MSKNEDFKLFKGKGNKKNQFAGMNINSLASMRIIQKHLVYVIGLSSNLANKDVYIKNIFLNNFIGFGETRILRSIWYNYKNCGK
jgi:hypothetical protein